MRASFNARWLLVPAFAVLALEARAQSALVQAEVVEVRAQTTLVQGDGGEGLVNGMRVRLRTGAGLRFTGRLLSRDDSSLSVVDEQGLALKVKRDQIAKIEVETPRTRAQGALRWGAWGGLGMAVVGGSLYAADQATKRDDGLCGDIETGVTKCTTGSEVALVALSGALIGATIGAIVPGERWQALKPDRLKLALGPGPRGGVFVRAALSF